MKKAPEAGGPTSKALISYPDSFPAVGTKIERNRNGAAQYPSQLTIFSDPQPDPEPAALPSEPGGEIAEPIANGPREPTQETENRKGILADTGPKFGDLLRGAPTFQNPAISIPSPGNGLTVEGLADIGKPEPDKWKSGFDLVNSSKKEIDFLAPGLFHRVGLAALIGGSDSGKSTFLRQLLVTIAAGRNEFMGFPLLPKHNSGLFISTEDDETTTGISLRTLTEKAGIAKDTTGRARFLFEPEKNLLDTIETELTRQPADVVILDCFSDLYDKQLNQNNEIRQFLNPFQALATKFQTLFIFLHHTRKGSQKEAPHKDNSIGSQGIEAKARLVIEFRADPNDPETRHLCIVKGNYLPPSAKSESYVLRFSEWFFEATGDRVKFADLLPGSERRQPMEEKIEIANGMLDAGYSKKDIATRFGISAQAISQWKLKQ